MENNGGNEVDYHGEGNKCPPIFQVLGLTSSAVIVKDKTNSGDFVETLKKNIFRTFFFSKINQGVFQN